MNNDKLLDLTAAEISRGVRDGELTAQAVVGASLEHIRRTDPEMKAFLSVFEKSALEEARRIDADVSKGKNPGRLAGVPFAAKDNMCVRAEATTCGSEILENYCPPYDATVVAKMKAEGAVLVGKTNMDEFAMGSSTENSAYFPSKNPWDLERVPGGSSGGSAAAVAAKMVPLSLGSDTGGSIRQPAAFCGIVGMKPTYGAVSRYGLVAFASSLDQIGPFARSVEDAALALSVIAGHDPLDSTSAPESGKDFLSGTDKGLKGLRIGLPKEYFDSGLDPEVAASVRGAAQAAEKAGASLVEVSLPHTRYALSAYYIIAPSEASSNLARFDGIRYGFRSGDATGGLADIYEASRGAGFGPEVKRRIMLGTYALSSGYYDAFYVKAQKARTLIKRDFEKAYEQADVLLTPTTPTPAFKFGDKKDPLQMYLSDIYTIPCNISGHGGLSMPCGKTKSGLPIGVQWMCRPGEEALLFRAAKALESALPAIGSPRAAA